MQWAKHKNGFTIVELLIVIVIIAILAAITIVAYNGIQERAKTASAQSATTQAVKKILAYAVQNNDQYPDSLAQAGITNTAGLQYSGGGSSYCVTGTAQNVSFFQGNTTSKATQGACQGHGANGAEPISNLITNPSLETNGTNWVARWFGTGGSGTTQRVAAAAYCGDIGYRKTWQVTGSSQDLGFTVRADNLTAGQSYTFSVYVRSSLATGHRAWITWYDAASTNIGGGYSSSTEVAVSADTWRRLTSTSTAPANAVKADLTFGPYPSAGSPNYTAGATLDADCAMLNRGSQLYTYADGSSDNWVWSNTAHASTSTGSPL